MACCSRFVRFLICIMVIFIALNTGFIWLVVTGITNIDRCPADTQLPTWLIVFGAVGIGMSVIIFLLVCNIEFIELFSEKFSSIIYLIDDLLVML